MKKPVVILLMLIMMLSSISLYGCGGTDSGGGSGSNTENAGPDYKDITAEELKTMMNENKNLVVVDVREQQEWDQGHLAGSILIPTSEFQARVNELPKDKAIAVVCASGARSAQVSAFLIQSGYTEVYNLSGGLAGWPNQLVK